MGIEIGNSLQTDGFSRRIPEVTKNIQDKNKILSEINQRFLDRASSVKNSTSNVISDGNASSMSATVEISQIGRQLADKVNVNGQQSRAERDSELKKILETMVSSKTSKTLEPMRLIKPKTQELIGMTRIETSNIKLDQAAVSDLRKNMLNQAQNTMLAQANQQANSVIKLLE